MYNFVSVLFRKLNRTIDIYSHFQYMSDSEADFAVLLRSGMWEMRGSLSSNRYRYNAICQYGTSETSRFQVGNNKKNSQFDEATECKLHVLVFRIKTPAVLSFDSPNCSSLSVCTVGRDEGCIPNETDDIEVLSESNPDPCKCHAF